MAESSRDFFHSKYVPWALIVGAAQGMGSAFAEEIARQGLNLAPIAALGQGGPFMETDLDTLLA